MGKKVKQAAMMELELCDFKTIKVYQPKVGYRFSFEPFFLANLDIQKHCKVAADIGSGCGIISILLAKKTSIEKIYAVENNLEYIDILNENIRINNVNNIFVTHSIENLPNNFLDLVISNPPYYTKSSFRLSKKYETQKFESIPLLEIIKNVRRKIKHNATLRLSFHTTRLFELLNILDTNKFGVKTIQLVYGNKNKISKVCIVEAKYNSKTYITIEKPIFLEEYKLY
ncbi:MAG: methyltransferase [Desulfurella sp.]